MKTSNRLKYAGTLGQGQDVRLFLALKEELIVARGCLPEVTVRNVSGKIRKRGDILPFIKGLRLSARLIYILRKKLLDCNMQINWGHVQDDERRMCSPECDIIIHKGGTSDRWNGDDQNSVMDFHFINKKAVKAVISCKSIVEGIDVDFATVVKKEFGIKNLFIFAEAARATRYEKLKKQAKTGGYKGLWALYQLDNDGTEVVDHNEYLTFLAAVRKCL